MFNYGGYPPWSGPSTPVVFMPPAQTPPSDPVETISRQIQQLEAMKKMLKEEKKEDKKKDDDTSPKVISMMLLMILLSPITGPIMSWFFKMGVHLVHASP